MCALLIVFAVVWAIVLLICVFNVLTGNFDERELGVIFGSLLGIVPFVLEKL